MMRYCKNCGTQLRDGASFCPKCGNPVAQPGQAAPNAGCVQPGQAGLNAGGGNPMPQKGNKKAIGIIAGIIGLIVVAVVLISVFLTGCYLGHDWQEADCTTPMTCAKCGKTEGEALGHEWQKATCTVSKTCSVCGETEGGVLGHTWTDATCTVSKTCSVCRETEGSALGHIWIEATCTTPKTCSVCGATEGGAAEHDLNSSGKCTVCGEQVGFALNMSNYKNYLSINLKSRGAGIHADAVEYTIEPTANVTFCNVTVTIDVWGAEVTKRTVRVDDTGYASGMLYGDGGNGRMTMISGYIIE